MSKSILVIDTPENCNECELHALTKRDYDKEFYCTPIGKIVDEFANNGTKPDWCPLKDVPEKRDQKTVITYFDGWNSGYNACIDEILKGDGAELK